MSIAVSRPSATHHEATESAESAGIASHQCYSEVVSRKLTQRELRNESGEIMRALDRGERFVITRRGVPVGELAPVGRHRRVSAAALLDAFERVPAIDAHRLRSDLDAIAAQDPEPRA